MIQQLLHIIILSIICITWGIPVLLIFLPTIEKDNYWYHSKIGLFSFLFFCGCLLIGLLSSWIYLWAPLHFEYLGVLTFFLLIFLILFQRKKIALLFLSVKKSQPVSFIPFLFVIISLLLFIVLAALKPVNGDTQIYHMQVIRWQQDYKIVPGIVNLYPRLGLGSNWFNLISFFYWPSFKNENFTYLNASFVAWFFIWLVTKWNFFFRNAGENNSFKVLSVFYFLLLLYCMFDWQLYRDSANSTNYDFVINALVIIVLSFFIEGVIVGDGRENFSPVVLFFSLSAIGFKLSGVFILFPVLYHIVVSWKTVRWFLSIFLEIIILLPVLLKNYIVTGYPLFPAIYSIGSPDWAFPKAMAKIFFEHIELSNKFYNYQWTFIHQVPHRRFNWIPYWFKGILWQHKVIFLTSFVSVFFFFKKPGVALNYNKLRLLILATLCMEAGWFFTAPDPGRFGYGTLLCLSFLTISLLIYPLLKKIFYIFSMIITIVIVTVYTYKKSKPIIEAPQYFVFPQSYANPSYNIISKKNIELKIPNIVDENWDRRCYFLSLPCIIQDNPYLVPRGNSTENGFKMVIPSSDTAFIYHYEY